MIIFTCPKCGTDCKVIQSNPLEKENDLIIECPSCEWSESLTDDTDDIRIPFNIQSRDKKKKYAFTQGTTQIAIRD